MHKIWANNVPNRYALPFERVVDAVCKTEAELQTNYVSSVGGAVGGGKKRWPGVVMIVVGLVLVLGVGANVLKYFGGGTKAAGGRASSQTDVLSPQDYRDLDERTWPIVIDIVQCNNQLMDAITSYSDGKLSAVELYSICEDASEYFAQASLSFSGEDGEEERVYLQQCKNYALAEQVLANSLKKYLDSFATKDLARVKENIREARSNLEMIASNRGILLVKAGYTEEEIRGILDELDRELAGDDAGAPASSEDAYLSEKVALAEREAVDRIPEEFPLEAPQFSEPAGMTGTQDPTAGSADNWYFPE